MALYARKSTRNRVIGVVATSGLAAATVLLLPTVSEAAGASFPAHYSAPYLQIASSDAADMEIGRAHV